MADRTNTTVRMPSSPGLLRPEAFARHAVFDETAPTAEAAHWVQSIWSVTWDLPPGQRHVAAVVPHPTVSLTVERGGGRRAGRNGSGVYLTGVVTRRFEVVQEGTGGVVGVKFRPGGFTALTSVPAARLRDGVVRAGAHCAGAGQLHGIPLSATESAGTLSHYVVGLSTGPDQRYDRLTRVLRAMTDPGATRVEQVAQTCGLSVRSLQRLLHHYVGVGPKWLLARHRLHDAIARIDAGLDGSLADLAADLGWYDQNHFTRDFTALVGVPPAAYRDRRPPDSPRAQESS